MAGMIPTRKTPVKTRLAETTICLYGPPKIGKSTWCAEIPGALFLATEPGLDFLEVYQTPLSSWPELLAALAEIYEACLDGTFGFQTIVLDTLDNAYRWCEEFVCEQLGIKHPSEVEYGGGYSRVRKEWARVLSKAATLPVGLVLVGHSVDREKKTKYGTRTMTGLTIGDKPSQVVYDLCSLVLYTDIDEDVNGQTTRVVRTKPSTTYHAGDRTGRLPEALPLMYSAFVEAFGAPQPELDREEALEREQRLAETGFESEQARHLAEAVALQNETAATATTFPDRGQSAPAPCVWEGEIVEPDDEDDDEDDDEPSALKEFRQLMERVATHYKMTVTSVIENALDSVGAAGYAPEEIVPARLAEITLSLRERFESKLK